MPKASIDYLNARREAKPASGGRRYMIMRNAADDRAQHRDMMLFKVESELGALAQRIEAEHSAVANALQSALAHAIAAGELLIEAKRKVRHGQWLEWLTANCSVPKRTAAHYMALARRRQKLCDQNGNVLPISVNHAAFLLKHPCDSEGLGDCEYDWGEYVPYRGWGRLAWGAFTPALQTVLRLPQLSPPAPRYIVKAARAGKTPGLSAAALREVISLLTRYADALEKGIAAEITTANGRCSVNGNAAVVVSSLFEEDSHGQMETQ
jgi:hypothetical protein